MNVTILYWLSFGFMIFILVAVWYWLRAVYKTAIKNNYETAKDLFKIDKRIDELAKSPRHISFDMNAWLKFEYGSKLKEQEKTIKGLEDEARMLHMRAGGAEAEVIRLKRELDKDKPKPETAKEYMARYGERML